MNVLSISVFGCKIPGQTATYLQKGRGWRFLRDFPGWNLRFMRSGLGPGSLTAGNNGPFALSINQKMIGTHQLVERLHPWYGNMVLAGSNFILLMLHRDTF